MNKMVMAVIPRDEAEMVLDALINGGHTATFLETKGGMLRQSQYTLFTAVKEEDVESVCEIIEKNCKVDVGLDEEELAKQELLDESNIGKLGGAIVFIWDLTRIENY